MATQGERSGTLVGHAPPPGGSASADATGIRSIQPSVVAPSGDAALAPTIPAPEPSSPRDTMKLELWEHGPESFAKLAPTEIRHLIEANESDWDLCSWKMLAQLDVAQREVVPDRFYWSMGSSFLKCFDMDAYRSAPSWLMNAMRVPAPTAREGTSLRVAEQAAPRAFAYKVLVIGVPLIGLVGLWLVLHMLGWP